MDREPFLKTEYVSVRGINTRFSKTGKGDTIIFLHGFPETLQTWRFVIPRLTDHFQCVALDLKGFGYSDKPQGDYSPWGMADFVKDFMDTMKIDSASLVATDTGLNIGCAFAVKFSKRIKKLILMAGTIYKEGIAAPEVVLLTVKPLGELILYRLGPVAIKMGLKKGFYGKERISQELFNEYYNPFRESLGRKRALELMRSYNKAASSMSEEVKKINKPTLILWAQYERFFHISTVHRLRREIKNSRLEIISDSGHFIQEERPEEVVRLITVFVT